jgi:hypothetical protein
MSKAWSSKRGLQEHWRKHGREVALVREPSKAPYWSEHHYAKSSEDTFKHPCREERMTHKDDCASGPPAHYSLDKNSLLTISDQQNECRIITHFPLGAFGNEGAKWLGELPEEMKEVHGLRCLYRRIRARLYVHSGRAEKVVIEQLERIVSAEIECIDRLRSTSTGEQVSWLKTCLVVDWDDARHKIRDRGIFERAQDLTTSFRAEAETLDYVRNELDRLKAGAVGQRLTGGGAGSLPDRVGENSWVCFESFVLYAQLSSIPEILDPQRKGGCSPDEVNNLFLSHLRRLRQMPGRFRKQFKDYVKCWLGSVSWAHETRSYQTIKRIQQQLA